MRRTVETTILTVLFFATLTVFAESDTSSAKDTLRFKAMEQHMVQELGLNKDQQVKMKSLHADMKNIRKEHGDRMKVIMDKSKNELLKDSPSRAVLYGLAKEMGDLRTAMAKKEADHLLKLKTILTPEQFKKLLSKPPHEPMPPDGMDGPGDRDERHHNR